MTYKIQVLVNNIHYTNNTRAAIILTLRMSSREELEAFRCEKIQ